MKIERVNRLFRLSVIIALCWGTTVSAKECHAVTAKLKHKFQHVTFKNESGLEYYEISRTNPDDYDAELCGIANAKGKVLIPYTRQYVYIFPIRLQDPQSKNYLPIYYWALQTTDNQFGVADKNGKIIIPCTPCGGIYLVEYITPKGSSVDYDYKRDGWAFVMHTDSSSALFDEKGNELIPLARGYTDISPRVDEHGGKYIQVIRDGKIGRCDTNGKEL